MRLLNVKFLIFLKTMFTIIIHLRLVAKSRHRRIYINLKQIVHSLNLRSPLFRIDWCGNYRPSPRRTFHSSRRSGGIIRCSLLFFKGTHGLVVPPRHGSFLLQKKN